MIGEIGLLRMFPAWKTTDLTIIIPDKENQAKGYDFVMMRILKSEFLALHNLAK